MLFIPQSAEIADAFIRLVGRSMFAQDIVANLDLTRKRRVLTEANHMKRDFTKAKRINWWYLHLRMVALTSLLALICAGCMCALVHKEGILHTVGAATICAGIVGGVLVALLTDDYWWSRMIPEKYTNWMEDYSGTVREIQLIHWAVSKITSEFRNLAEARRAPELEALAIVTLNKSIGEASLLPQVGQKYAEKARTLRVQLLQHLQMLNIAAIPTPSYKAHFASAEERWCELAAQGKVPTDYQI